jgi:hypothetical protein
MVDRAGEMHVEDEWHAVGLAEPATSEANVAGLDILRRR